MTYTQFAVTMHLSTGVSGALTASSDWADAGTAVTYVSPIAISLTERYMINSADLGTNTVISSVDSTHATANPEYYHQFSVVFQYSVTDGSPTAPTAYYTQFGGAHTVVAATDLHVIGWVDAGTAVSYDNPISAVGSERWQADFTVSGGESVIVSSVSGSTLTIDPTYYHQFDVTFKYSVSDSSTPTAPTAYYMQFGGTASKTADSGGSASDWVDAGTAVVYTNPLVDSSVSERWQADYTVSLGKSVIVSSVSGSTLTIDPTYYHQFLVTFAYTTNDNTLIDKAISQFITYTQYGAPTYVSLSAQGALSLTSDWADINTPVTYVSPVSISSNERYMITAADGGSNTVIANVGSTLASRTADPMYYHQYVITFGYASVNDIVNAIPSGNPIGSYTQFGAATGIINSGATYGSTTPASDWVDAGTNTVSYTTYTNGAGTERWALLAGTNSYSVSSSTTVSEQNYYHQFKITFGYSVANDASSIASGLVIGNYYQFGASYQITSTGVGTGVSPSVGTWVDSGARKVDYQTVTASSTTERWALLNSPQNHDVTASGTLAQSNYFHQFDFSLSYSIVGGATGASAPTLTSTQFGVAYTPSLTGSATAYWLDNGASWSITNPLVGSGSTEQWMTNQSPTSGTVSAAQTTAYTYYHQYQVSASYSTSDGTTPSASITLSGTQFGNSAYTLTLTTSVQSPWLDAGTSWSVNDPIIAVSGTERWSANGVGTSGTVTGAITIAPVYYHQYQITFGYSVVNGPSIIASNLVVGSYYQFGSLLINHI